MELEHELELVIVVCYVNDLIQFVVELEFHQMIVHDLLRLNLLLLQLVFHFLNLLKHFQQAFQLMALFLRAVMYEHDQAIDLVDVN